MAVIVTLEIEELRLQIRRRPQQGAVQTFAPNGANQAFNEGMGERHVRHRLDFPDVEDAQIRLPLAEPIQGMMVRAEIFRRGLASSRSIEHSAQPHDIHDTAIHGKATPHHVLVDGNAEGQRDLLRSADTPTSDSAVSCRRQLR